MKALGTCYLFYCRNDRSTSCITGGRECPPWFYISGDCDLLILPRPPFHVPLDMYVSDIRRSENISFNIDGEPTTGTFKLGMTTVVHGSPARVALGMVGLDRKPVEAVGRAMGGEETLFRRAAGAHFSGSLSWSISSRLDASGRKAKEGVECI